MNNKETKSGNPLQDLLESILENIKLLNAKNDALNEQINILNRREVVKLDQSINDFKEEMSKATEKIKIQYMEFIGGFRSKMGGVTIPMEHTDRKKVEQFNWYLKKYWYLPFGLMSCSMLILLCSMIFAHKFYKSSISTKQEVMNELGRDGKMIIDKQDFLEMRNELQMIEEWKKLNPNDSRSLQNFELGRKLRGR